MTNIWNIGLLITMMINIEMAKADAQRSNGPMIIPNSSELILQNGQNFTLKCQGKSEMHWRRQESVDSERSPPTETKSSISEGDYKFQVSIELVNVDQFAIGYYACFDDSVNGTNILANLDEEPENSEHISFIYIYVAGTGTLLAPMRDFIVSVNKTKILIECRPTTPDVDISLTLDIPDLKIEKYSPKVGFLIDSDNLMDKVLYSANCNFPGRDNDEGKFIVIMKHMDSPAEPKILGGYNEFLEGETFLLNCTVKYDSSCSISLDWQYPLSFDKETISEDTNANSMGQHTGVLYKTTKVVNATKAHSGTYVCVSNNSCGNKTDTFEKKFIEKPYMSITNLNKENGNTDCLMARNVIQLGATVESYPPAHVSYKKNTLNSSYQISTANLTKFSQKSKVLKQSIDYFLIIKNMDIYDNANYILVANNGDETKTTEFCVRVHGKPNVTFGYPQEIRRDRGTIITLTCSVTGYPLPTIEWIFTRDEDNKSEVLKSDMEVEDEVYKKTGSLKLRVQDSGNITCSASNIPKKIKEVGYVSRKLLVYEITGGFGIWNSTNNWFPQDRKVVLTCYASKYDFVNVTWLGKDGAELKGSVNYSTNFLSHLTKLTFEGISVNDSGEYICRGVRNNGTDAMESISITVEALRKPVISDPSHDIVEEVMLIQQVPLTCYAEGVPPPTLQWFKDGKIVKNTTVVSISTETVNLTSINSTLEIKHMAKELKGTYECVVNSGDVEARRVYTVSLKAEASNVPLLSAILVVIFILILIVAYLTWKIRKEKAFRKELAAAGLLYFKEGVTKSLNPDLGIDQQAELLPYDEKFEFPYENLKLGKQLGSGAFGVVYKADARGIINAEETTEVAVKMVKKTADNMFIKALASELKIMVHMGKHVNIVNLLGACTKNVGKRELVVIVEYCKFGNIHNYLQRHRDVFIDQLTDNTEKSLGKVNRGFSCSSGSTGVPDYYFNSNTQNTDNTMVNTANSSRSTRKADIQPKVLELVRVSEGYVQPEWRSNYECDYSDGRAPRQLFSRDLLAWAFQIARGMEYLASRKVLHGDLAARNVLLAEDNVVKICDFGLARSIYKNDEYQKKENSLLPVKWLAIECMTDRIFSTQSDVWSFGIVLWELFSLAKTPYPNISPSELLQFLSKGERLEKPSYADDRLYNVMKRCWALKPTQRPTFTELQEILGGFLEDNVRNRFVDLNAAYIDVNAKPAGQEDYLAMVAAPDYNNLVTPSPHHYVNENAFFPLGHDEEGYLQMSPAKQGIFSPRFTDSKFDFDSRKTNPRVSEASSVGSELTPMLTLNNLPARSGSDSDHESNVSPYLKMCPKIIEETDEVFDEPNKKTENEIKQNNAKNLQRTAVTNPEYIIHFNDDIDKKPKDIINTYSNIPNGLVK